MIAQDPEGARRLCVLLADFLRASLTLGRRQRIPVREELEMAGRLLSIEKMRFGERLTFEIEADETVRECLLPPLVLQPMVENAITHGIAQLLEGGAIRIQARRNGERLDLLVENPYDPAAPRRKGPGVGLANVRARCAALYGAGAQLQLHDAQGVFRVSLGLPLERPTQDSRT